MTTQTSQTLVSSKPSDNMIRQIIRSLTKPDDTLKGDQRQKAASLIAMTLIFMPLGLIVVLATPIQNILNGNGFTTINSGGLVALSIALIAYVFSRTKYYQIGAYMIVATAAIGVIISTLSSGAPVSETTLFFISMSIILSSLLLNSWSTVVTGAIAIMIAFFLHTITTDGTQDLPVSILGFMLLTTGVLVLTARMREQNWSILISTQDELKLRIEEADDARQKAERSDHVKSTFLASMSHELRTPLNAIINFTRFVVKGIQGPVTDDQVETLNNVIISGKHLLNLINDVLDMSKIESDSLNLFVSDDVEIANILGDVATMGQALLDGKAVDLTVDIEESLPLIRGDQQRIHQIFLNIVSNACKFTESGTITLAAKQENSEILVSIADTGPGIAKEDMESVFEAFKQTTTGLRQGGGTGLGMPITKSLVEAHYGKIHMESTVGAGTEFHIHLPVRSENLTPTLIAES